MSAHRWLAVASGVVALSGCGSESARMTDAPVAKPAAPPPPSCQVAVNELLFRLPLRNDHEARDGLVGECIDKGWSANERRCVKGAADATSLRECVDVQTMLIVGSREEGLTLGIADCDRVIEAYRRCIPKALPPEIASDTQEALGLTLTRWRQQIADDADGGWRAVQRDCNELIESLRGPMQRYGCGR